MPDQPTPDRPRARHERDASTLAAPDEEFPTEVPDDETAYACDRCGRPFPDAESLTLHHGLAHYGDLTEAEREAFAEAYESEEADLRRFRIVALGLLVLLYFGFLMTYAAVT
jgi:hypothetical protein